ncbi:MAG: BlaI/MecI/CopY family transcriptional regulator [Candidatus Pacebacteria bacterium]|nr:BlaI/MecI/CopY family transcriptional regulator [Candidatus Paceibacterota bacterium]
MELINDKERRVMEALFKLGNCTVNQISKETLINRTALYHTLGLLIKKGLVTQVEKDKISYYEAISIEQYEKWVESKIETLKQTSKKDVAIFSTVKKDKKLSLYADVKYFEGPEGIRNFFADSIYNNKEKQILTITDYESGYAKLGDWFTEVYLPERVRKGVRVRSVLPDSPIGRSYVKSAKELLRDMCFVDIFKDLGIEMAVYDSKVTITVFDKKHPIGVIIKNDIIANAFREIFTYIWKTGEKVNIK